jgi:hypothetical protein
MTHKLREDMLTAPRLKERGWTAAMIRDLGDPDQLVPNPRYRSAAPMRLWSAERVATLESGDAFIARVEAGKTRSAASVAAADKRREQLLETLSAITFSLPVLDDDVLTRNAIRHRNDAREFHHSGAFREDFERVNPDDPSSIDPETLQRWEVNYLRHALTEYERELGAVAGKVGVRDAVDLIREKVYDAIAGRYPWLAGECGRQVRARSGP